MSWVPWKLKIRLAALHVPIYIYVPICTYYVQVANKTRFKCSGLWSPFAVKIAVYETPASCEASPLPLSAWSYLPEVFPMSQYLLHLPNPQASWWSFTTFSVAGGKEELNIAVKMEELPLVSVKLLQESFPSSSGSEGGTAHLSMASEMMALWRAQVPAKPLSSFLWLLLPAAPPSCTKGFPCAQSVS